MTAYSDRLEQIIIQSIEILYKKINGGIIRVENEASMQLQLGLIIKSIGDINLFECGDTLSIELEKPFLRTSGVLIKSGTRKAKIDIYVKLKNSRNNEDSSCALELKFLKKENHREPNNRYDVFEDISNLENYGEIANFGMLLVATDHKHYINQESYSNDTKDFDFRDGEKYQAGTMLEYKTKTPYGLPIVLNGNYNFKWLNINDRVSFLQLKIQPIKTN